MSGKAPIKVVTRNRKAWHHYFVDEEYEAGVVLLGSEVKSLRDGRVEMTDAYARFEERELLLIGLHIAAYPHATHDNHEPERTRKLLMHRRELNRLEHKVQTAGFTLIPLEIYFKGPRIKVKLGLCRGKKVFDKRQALKEKEAKRAMARAHAESHRQRRRNDD